MLSFLRKISSDTGAIPTGIKLVVLVLFLRTLGWGFIDPFFGMFIDTFANNYKGVGFLVAMMNVISLFAAIPLLRLADKVQDTLIMRDGEVVYLFAVLFYVAAVFTHNVYFLVFALLFSGVGGALIMIGAESYIRRYSKLGAEAKSFGFYTALNYLGWVLGMILGAFTVQYYGLEYMFFILLPSIVLGFIVLKHIHEGGLKSLFTGFQHYFHRRKDLQIIINDMKSLNKRAYFFLAVAFLDGIIVMFSYIFVPLFAFSIDLGMREVALLMAFMYMPFIFSYLITEATDRLKRMNVIAMGLFIGGLSFIGLSFIIGQVWIVLLAAINSLSLAIIRPAYNGMLTHLTPRRMLGEITGLNKIAMRVGYIVGPIFAGFIADLYGLQFSFMCIAILAFSLGALTIILRSYESLINTKDA